MRQNGEEEDEQKNNEGLDQAAGCFEDDRYENHGHFAEHNYTFPEISSGLEAIVEEAKFKTDTSILKTSSILPQKPPRYHWNSKRPEENTSHPTSQGPEEMSALEAQNLQILNQTSVVAYDSTAKVRMAYLKRENM